MNALNGQWLDHYKIINQHGEGHMGTVYTARDQQTGDLIALHVLHAHLARRPDFTQRFLQAMENAKRLYHPALVKVHACGQAEQQRLYVATDLVQGPTLATVLASLQAAGQWLVLSESVALVQRVAMAVEYLHRLQAPARDFRPDHLHLTVTKKTDPDLVYQPILTDLGLTGLLDAELATLGTLAPGSYGYMAPEQIRGQTADARSAVYSLGILAYALVSGQLPFVVNNLPAALDYHSRELPHSVRSRYPALPPVLEQVLVKALAQQPDMRFATPGEMAAALAATLPAAKAVREGSSASKMVSLAVWIPQMGDQPVVPPKIPALTTPPVVSVAAPKPASAVVDPVPAAPTKPLPASILIIDPQGQQRTVPIQLPTMTIGREDDNDLVLSSDAKVSRHHLRLELDGNRYRVTDLGSRNGFGLGGQEFPSGTAQPWSSELLLVIGLHKLRLVADASFPSSVDSLVDSMVSITVETPVLTVEPSESVTLTLAVLNQSSIVDNFRIAITDLPPLCQVHQTPVVHLLPGRVERVQITIQSKRSSQCRAGRYPLAIQVTKQETATVVGRATAQLTVTPFHAFRSEMQPVEIRAGKPAQIWVENQGNAKQTYHVSWKDRAGELHFEPATATLIVDAGETVTVDFSAKPPRRIWIGGEKQYTITAQVAPQSGSDPKGLPGNVVNKGLLPNWLPPAVPVLLLGAFFGLRSLFMPTLQVTTTPNPALINAPMIIDYEAANARSVEIYAENKMITTGLPAKGSFSYQHGLPEQSQLDVIANGWFGNEEILSITAVAPTPTPLATVTPLPLPTFKQCTANQTLFMLGEPTKLALTCELDFIENATVIQAIANGKAEEPLSKVDAHAVAELEINAIGVTTYTFSLTASSGETIKSATTLTVKVIAPRLIVAADGLFLRAGPCPAFPEIRAVDKEKTILHALSRPIQPGTALEWVNVRVDGTGEIGWVAYGGEFTQPAPQVDPSRLPEPVNVPPCPTPTPEPTGTPTPVPTPQPPADISVSVEPSIIKPGQCVTVRWNIQHVSSVRLNGEGVQGDDQGSDMEKEVCGIKKTTTFTWEIVKEDGSHTVREKTVTVLP